MINMNSSETGEDHDTVAIVGAGPVGIALANELGWRGIPNLLIERRTELLGFPTCESVHTRTLEIFRRWGLSDAVRFSGFPPDLHRNVHFVTTLEGKEILRVDRPSNREELELSSCFSPEGALWCPKFLLDKTLLDGASKTGMTEFLTGHELVAFEQDDTGVTLDVECLATGQHQKRRVRFLAACDGASSPVRKALGIEMEGTFSEGRNLGIFFSSEELQGIMEQREGVMAEIINPRFSANLSAVDGKSRWRLVFFERDRDPHSLDPVSCINRAVGRSIEAEVIDSRVWAGHSAVAARFQDGNVFLLGDAANLRWPRGGFGMNTGLADVGNLGWKLEAALQGWGGEHLLDSYEPERRPVAIATVKEASTNYRSEAELNVSPVLEDDSLEGAVAREVLGKEILATRLQEWNTQGVQLGLIYEDSPVCIAEGTPPPEFNSGIYEPTTRPGARAPHIWLNKNKSILDCFGKSYCIVHSAPDKDIEPFLSCARELGIQLTVIQLERPEDIALYERRFVLVRPDGHVCWRSDEIPENIPNLLNHVRGAAPAVT